MCASRKKYRGRNMKRNRMNWNEMNDTQQHSKRQRKYAKRKLQTFFWWLIQHISIQFQFHWIIEREREREKTHTTPQKTLLDIFLQLIVYCFHSCDRMCEHKRTRLNTRRFIVIRIIENNELRKISSSSLSRSLHTESALRNTNTTDQLNEMHPRLNKDTKRL